ncbi:MAG: coenzyme F420-0:L-glutamate ligase [Dehalococcoidaceae bacterium]|nr:coenzyme F420-0:L-glutamate ligase [Dehalococcoidaceae bacterium]
MQNEIRILGVPNFPIIEVGDDLPQIIIDKIEESEISLENDDVIVVTQRICSIAEGQIKNLNDFTPSEFAVEWAQKYQKDARLVEAVLQEAKNIIRQENGILITETQHGFICANSGIDNSNVQGNENICLLPKNPDLSCKKIKDNIKKILGKNVSVIMTDTFGRPWRMGQTNVAIGVAGINPLQNYIGEKDIFERTLQHTMICIADEIASAAELIMGKTNMTPVVIVKGYNYDKKNDSINNVIREKESDLFR